MNRTGPVHQISQKTSLMDHHHGTAPDESRSARLAGNRGTRLNRSSRQPMARGSLLSSDRAVRYAGSPMHVNGVMCSQ